MRRWRRLVAAAVAAATLAGCGAGVARSPATMGAAARTAPPTVPPGAAPTSTSALPDATPMATLSTAPPLGGHADDGGVWAVVVGIDDYPGRSRDLRSAVNDAGDMDAALTAYGVPEERRILLRDGQATAAALGQALDWLVTRAGPTATAVFFYAGHVREVAPGTEALVGADGGLVTDRAVADHLAGLRAAKTWIVVAGCYAGGFTEVMAPGRILTGASPAGRLAFESTALGRSYLVEYMIRRAMLEQRAPTVEAAFAWARAALRRDAPGRIPVQFDEIPGDLALGPVPATPAPPPPHPPAPPPSGPRPPPPPPPSPTTTAPPARPCPITLLACPEG